MVKIGGLAFDPENTAMPLRKYIGVDSARS